MIDPQRLAVYANDHLAGATAALELLGRLASAPDAPASDVFARLYEDVLEDRRQLEALLARIGERASGVKQAAGWLAEKLARLKLGAGAGDDALERFEALEILALGILGKRSLWRALGVVAATDPALAALDFARLEARADEQYARVERERLLLAPAALGSERRAAGAAAAPGPAVGEPTG